MRHLLHPLPEQAEIAIDSPINHRLKRVLRLQVGQALTLCDGRGCTQEVRWQDKLFVPIAEVKKHLQLVPELHLAPGVLKGERQDWLVEKASELGVDVLTPLLLDHGVVRVHDRAEKQARWQAIADGALEQCGRTWRMVVAPPMPLAEWLTGNDGFFADETGGSLWQDLVRERQKTPWRVTLGVEGGWSEKERALLKSRNYRAISVGPLVLRAETAALAVAAIARANG